MCACVCALGGVPLRLAGGDSMASGRLEIYWNMKWYTMCGWSGWDINAATVICRQIGFAGAVSTGMSHIDCDCT